MRVGLALGLLSFAIAACGGESDPTGADPQPAEAAPAAPASALPKAPLGAQPASSPVLDKIRAISDIPVHVEDPHEAVAQLRPWIADGNRELREAAILALWDVDHESANEMLASVARNESDPELKGYAVEELVDREAPQALDALLHVLNDADIDLREQAAEGLESLEDPRAIPSLRARLELEEDEWVRDALLSALSSVDPDFDEDEYLD